MARAFSHIAVLTLLCTLSGFSLATARLQDEDPVYDGKKGSAWVDILINDTSARKRALAVDALARLWAEKQYKEAIPSIGRALRVDSSAAVRIQAAQALGRLRETDIKGGLGVKDLVDAMGMEKESRVRREIATVLVRFPLVAKLAVVQLTAALKDPDSTTRVVVAEALAQTGMEGKSAAAELAPLLSDKEKAVRRAAVVALGRISPEGASAIAESLSKMLETEKELDLRTELVISLGILGEKSPTVVMALAQLLADSEDELRRRAIRTLGTFGVAATTATEELLKAAKTDKLKDIRIDAVRAFGSAVGPDLKGRVKDLIPILESDPDFEVRLAVVEEIGSLGPALKDDQETMKVLRKRLSDPHVKVREAVGLAIRKIEKKVDPKKDPEVKKLP
jgi:HEAT repeat protein